MFFIFGHRLFGKVDHVPGVLFISTQFYHINYLPLYPVKSYIIREEDGLGVPIPLNYRSILMAWARMGLLAMAVVFAVATIVAALQGSTHVFLFAGSCLPAAYAWILLSKHPVCCTASYDRALEWANQAGIGPAGLARLRRLYEPDDASALPIAPAETVESAPEPAVFFIMGKQRDNGQDVCVTVWAKDADQANQIGLSRGVDVTKVEPTGPRPRRARAESIA
jgi:hypothetical protein